MEPYFMLATGVVPLAYVTAALFAQFARRSPRFSVAATAVASFVALAGAVVTVGSALVYGSQSSAVIGLGGWGMQLLVDPLSATMLALVAAVGLVVVRYSHRYLDGDQRQAVFLRDLALTLGGVSMFVVSGNLAQLVAGWLVTGVGVHNLLTYYRDRPRARLAARKKFVVARVGDLALIGAVTALGLSFATADIAEIGTLAAGLGHREVDGLAISAAVLLAIAAALKTAQFPTHGWLLDVMEAPTPVSALLHAGLVNAGGFIIIRFADVVTLSPGALAVLATLGALSAVFGAAAMNAQTRVKTRLAYSTVAQMGFMLLQCGLGAFSSAVLHLVAHSVYKAHAFLRSGSEVETAARTQAPPDRSIGWLAAAFVGAGLVFTAAGALFGFDPAAEPGVFVLGGSAALGLAYMVASTTRSRGTLVVATAVAATLSLVYFALQAAAHAVYGSIAPSLSSLPVSVVAAGGLAMAGFVGLAVLQWRLPRAKHRMARVYVALKNGLYVNAGFDRALSRPVLASRTR